MKHFVKVLTVAIFYLLIRNDMPNPDKAWLAEKVIKLTGDNQRPAWDDLSPMADDTHGWRMLAIDNDGRKFGLSWTQVTNAVKNNVSEPSRVKLIKGSITDVYDAGYTQTNQWW